MGMIHQMGAPRHMGASHVSRDRRLTKEQGAIRLRSLRILARMIVRAHLRSLSKQEAAGDCFMPDAAPHSDASKRGSGRAG